jgi:hypothetical protein
MGFNMSSTWGEDQIVLYDDKYAMHPPGNAPFCMTTLPHADTDPFLYALLYLHSRVGPPGQYPAQKQA